MTQQPGLTREKIVHKIVVPVRVLVPGSCTKFDTTVDTMGTSTRYRTVYILFCLRSRNEQVYIESGIRDIPDSNQFRGNLKSESGFFSSNIGDM